MLECFDNIPLYYNGKEVKIIWECREFGLVGVKFLGAEKTLFIDEEVLSKIPEIEQSISIKF